MKLAAKTLLSAMAWLFFLKAGGSQEVRRSWLDAGGRNSPYSSDSEILDFLRTAKAVSTRKVGAGVTGALQVLLEKNGIRMHGIFRHVRERRRKVLPSGRVLIQRDDFAFEPAAYELSRLLGLDNVPPAVLRSVRGRKGSLQIWIEKSFTERYRREAGIGAPDEESIRLQYEILGVFDNLIYNDDRNRGNILFDAGWKLWMIDHTRAFRPYEELPYPRVFRRCERALWQRLRELAPDEVGRRMAPFLDAGQIAGLLKRREALIEQISDLIDEEGESAVLFRLP